MGVEKKWGMVFFGGKSYILFKLYITVFILFILFIIYLFTVIYRAFLSRALYILVYINLTIKRD